MQLEAQEALKKKQDLFEIKFKQYEEDFKNATNIGEETIKENIQKERERLEARQKEIQESIDKSNADFDDLRKRRDQIMPEGQALAERQM